MHAIVVFFSKTPIKIIILCTKHILNYRGHLTDIADMIELFQVNSI